MEKSRLNTIIIVVVVIVLALVIINWKNQKPPVEVTDELSKCIGRSSVLYVQTGCSHCKVQEDMFGTFLNNLNMINCATDIDKCTKAGIEFTPTWIIKGKTYTGVQEIKTLKELTGC